MVQQVLCIGQSDSSAGTGIQADIKTIMNYPVYASTVVTAVSVQNTHSVKDMHMLPAAVVKQQIDAVMEDLTPRVIKTGMLGTEEIINVVGDFLDNNLGKFKIVIDPVMTSRSGATLLDKPARDAIKRRLLIYADVLTPNIQEASDLTGVVIKSLDDMKHAAEMLLTLGAKNIVVKGGGLPTELIHTIYVDENGVEEYTSPRINTKVTHGAGTTLSAGIAAGMAMGKTPRKSFAASHAFLVKAIETGEMIGHGYGPVNHAWKVQESAKK